MDNLLEKNKEDINEKKSRKNERINTLLILLFAITICSLWGGLYSTSYANSNAPVLLFTKNFWIYWLWLPIPIASIILGFKYKKAGFKCTKNIVAGFIIGIFLLIYGSFCLLPTGETEYKKIYDYQDILSLKVPSNGILIMQDYDTHFDKNIKDITIIDVYYTDVDVTQFEQDIKNNANWIKASQLSSSLKIFLPFTLSDYTQNLYVCIYNETLNEYNLLPKDSGNYVIYTMFYRNTDKLLEINKFTYEYTK